jgi:SAM-dependent methyltransferase
MDEGLPGGVVDRRAEVLPPALLPLFDDRFVTSWKLYGAFVERLVAHRADALGLAAAAGGDGVTPGELAERIGCTGEGSETVLSWILRTLRASGAVREATTGEPPRYLFADPTTGGDPSRLRAELLAHDDRVLPAVELAELAAASLPAFLAGEVAGERVLLAPDQLPLWSRYFSNDNPLYAINNAVGAEACVASLRPGAVRVLELGGGLGSAADALLGRLETAGRLPDVTSYRFTDLVVPFLRRGQRSLQARWGDRTALSFARLDMDRPLQTQGVEAGSVDLVWAVNTLHVARDLRRTLRDICSVLAPGGVLVAGECVRPYAGQALAPELIFNLLESFRSPVLDERWRPHGGFLTPEQWLAVAAASGFAEVQLVPDMVRVREVFRDFVVAAVVARTAP